MVNRCSASSYLQSSGVTSTLWLPKITLANECSSFMYMSYTLRPCFGMCPTNRMMDVCWLRLNDTVSKRNTTHSSRLYGSFAVCPEIMASLILHENKVHVTRLIIRTLFWNLNYRQFLLSFPRFRNSLNIVSTCSYDFVFTIQRTGQKYILITCGQCTFI